MRHSRSNLTLIIGILLCLFGAAIIAYYAFKSGIQQGAEIAEERQQVPPTGEPSTQLPNETQPPFTDPASPTLQQSPTLAPLEAPEIASDGQLGAVHGKGKGNLVAVDKRYTAKAEMVHNQVLNPLMQLIRQAERDGVRLSIVSAYRSYDHQRGIWERKWGNSANDDTSKAASILRLSSFPGTSRHHWGTDIDFNSVSSSYWQSAEGRKAYSWLKSNAPNYGFCEVYGKGRSQGYEYEPWHWSYIPVAQQYYAQITNPSVFNTAITQNIKGGAAARALSAKIMTHVTAISPCPARGKGNFVPEPSTTKNPPPAQGQEIADNLPKKSALNPYDNPKMGGSALEPLPANGGLPEPKPVYTAQEFDQELLKPTASDNKQSMSGNGFRIEKNVVTDSQ